MKTRVRERDKRAALNFRVDDVEARFIDDLAGRLKMGRSTVARHLIRWASEHLGDDPSKLFSKR